MTLAACAALVASVAAGAPQDLFNSDASGLDLWSAIRQSVRHSPALRRSGANNKTHKTRSDSAYTVFLPRVDLLGRYSRISEEELPNIGGGFTFPQYLDNYLFQASASVPLSDYLLTLPSLYEIGKAGYAASAAQHHAETERVALEAAQAYFNVLARRAAERVQAEAAAAMRHRLKDLERLLAAGDATESDLMTVAAQAASLDRQAIAAEGNRKLAEARLKQMLGSDLREPLRLDFDIESSPPAPDYSAEQALRVAAEKRGELRALRASIRLQDAETDRRFAGMFPKLVAGGQYDVANPNQRIFPLTNEFNDNWVLFLGLSWSPNDFITERTLWKEATYSREAIDADLEALRDALELEIISALTSWEVADKSVQAAKEQHQAAARAYADKERLFELGEGTVQNVLDSEQAYRQSALGRINASIGLHLARLSYERSLGLLSENINPGKS